MTSAPSTTLFREGPDLDQILAELDEEYPGQVRVVDVSYDRVGGVMGFFAHRNVCVKYTLEDDAVDAADAAGAAGAAADGFEVVDSFVSSRTPAATVHASAGSSPLDALLSAAEADDRVSTGRAGAPALPSVPDSEIGTDAANVEFARMLLEMANAKRRAAQATESEADQPPRAETTLAESPAPSIAVPDVAVAAPQPVFTPPVRSTPVQPSAPAPAAFPTLSSMLSAAPVPAPEPAPAPIAPPAPVQPRTSAPAVPSAPADAAGALHDWAAVEPRRERARRAPGAHRAASDEAGERTEYSLRRQLVDIGVPVGWIPDRTADAYWVIEQLVSRVPTAEPSLVRPGDVLAVVGPAREAVHAAHELCRRLRLDPDSTLTIGCGDGALDQPWTVAATVSEARTAARAPLVVVVATDESGSDFVAADDAWLRDTVRAVNADQLFLIADATCKPADTRSLMHTVGRTDALIVVGAARTSSPASVWELDVPIALLDGRASTRGAWVALLIDKLTALES